jgi:hypothetical protein
MPFAVAAGISAGGSIIGGVMQSNTAANAQKQAQAQFQQQRTDVAPWRDAGGQTLTAQNNLLGMNGPDAANAAMANFQTSPGYQWQLGQGLRAIDAGAASKGLLGSGATIKAEETYGSGLANQDFTNYYNRLMGISTLGENAATGGAANAANSANATLAGANAQNSILGNTTAGLSNTANSLFSNKNFQNWWSGSGGGGEVPGGTWDMGDTGGTWDV